MIFTLWFGGQVGYCSNGIWWSPGGVIWRGFVREGFFCVYNKRFARSIAIRVNRSEPDRCRLADTDTASHLQGTSTTTTRIRETRIFWSLKTTTITFIEGKNIQIIQHLYVLLYILRLVIFCWNAMTVFG